MALNLYFVLCYYNIIHKSDVFKQEINTSTSQLTTLLFITRSWKLCKKKFLLQSHYPDQTMGELTAVYTLIAESERHVVYYGGQ